MHWAPQVGRSVPQKNDFYSLRNHFAMASDTIRVGAYTCAIQKAVCGKRVLDIGTGPFMLLSRLSLKAGAAYVAGVEASSQAVSFASELLEQEYLRACPVRMAANDKMRWENGRLNDLDRCEKLNNSLGLLMSIGVPLEVRHEHVALLRTPVPTFDSILRPQHATLPSPLTLHSALRTPSRSIASSRGASAAEGRKTPSSPPSQRSQGCSAGR